MKIYTHKARQVPVFDKCLSHDFKENQEKVIRLPEDDPEIVELFLKLLTFDEGHDYDHQMDHWLPSLDIADKRLIEVFILADKLGAENEQNQIVNLIRFLASNTPIDFECMDLLAEAGLQSTRIFRCMLIQASYDIKDHEGKTREKNEAWIMRGGEAVKDLINILSELDEKRMDPSLYVEERQGYCAEDLCRFHTHISTPSCV